MNRNALTTAVAIVCSFAVGLGWTWFTSNQNKMGVAVVDLDEVARQLGKDEEMLQSFQTAAGQLNQFLNGAQQNAFAKLEEIRSGLSDEASAEQLKDYNVTRQRFQLELNQLKQEAEGQLNQHRQQMVSQFRSDAKPIVARVAKEKGYATIVTRNDSVVFSYDEAVDITKDVIALMSAEMPAKPAKAATAQPAQQQTVAPQQTAQAPANADVN